MCSRSHSQSCSLGPQSPLCLVPEHHCFPPPPLSSFSKVEEGTPPHRHRGAPGFPHCAQASAQEQRDVGPCPPCSEASRRKGVGSAAPTPLAWARGAGPLSAPCLSASGRTRCMPPTRWQLSCEHPALQTAWEGARRRELRDGQRPGRPTGSAQQTASSRDTCLSGHQ